MSEDTTGQPTEGEVARKASGRSGKTVVIAVFLALALLVAFNMN